MLRERRSTLKDLHLAGVCAGREERISTSIFMTTARFVEKSPTKQGRGSELVPPQGLGKKCNIIVRQMYAPWFCLVTTKIWSNRHLSPRCITALGSWTNRVIALRQISVTALFYLEDSRKIHLRGVRAHRSTDARRRVPQRTGERASELALALLFICLSLPGPVLCKLGQPGVFVLPEVLTLVLRPFLFYFRGLFPSLSFSHHHFGLLFPILPT